MTRTPMPTAEAAFALDKLGDRLVEFCRDLDRLYERLPQHIRVQIDAIDGLDAIAPQLGRELVMLAGQLQEQADTEPDTAARAIDDALTGACRGARLSGLAKGRAL